MSVRTAANYITVYISRRFVNPVSRSGDDSVFFDDIGREGVAVDAAGVEADGARAAAGLG